MICGSSQWVLISLAIKETTLISLDVNIYILNYKAGWEVSDSCAKWSTAVKSIFLYNEKLKLAKS